MYMQGYFVTLVQNKPSHFPPNVSNPWISLTYMFMCSFAFLLLNASINLRALKLYWPRNNSKPLNKFLPFPKVFLKKYQ